jgi:hypothetical protein
MQTPMLTRIIDHACGPLAERIERSRIPSRMRVHPTVFECIKAIRSREIADGYPLMFLGMELVESENLPIEGFEFLD